VAAFQRSCRCFSDNFIAQFSQRVGGAGWGKEAGGLNPENPDDSRKVQNKK
jgi:hypothetical protein